MGSQRQNFHVIVVGFADRILTDIILTNGQTLFLTSFPPNFSNKTTSVAK
jgi:hypothetical protein